MPIKAIAYPLKDSSGEIFAAAIQSIAEATMETTKETTLIRDETSAMSGSMTTIDEQVAAIAELSAKLFQKHDVSGTVPKMLIS